MKLKKKEKERQRKERKDDHVHGFWLSSLTLPYSLVFKSKNHADGWARGGREVQEEGGIRIHIAYSLPCETAETNTTLWSN